MRESRTYGSVRGARGNPRPYRYRNGWREAPTDEAKSGKLCAADTRSRIAPSGDASRRPLGSIRASYPDL